MNEIDKKCSHLPITLKQTFEADAGRAVQYYRSNRMPPRIRKRLVLFQGVFARRFRKARVALIMQI